MDELLNAPDGGDIIFQSVEPSKLAYRLHEAFRVARIYPEFAHYIPVTEQYLIRARYNRVILERRDKQMLAVKVVQEQLSKMKLDEVTDVLGIVGAAITHKSDEIYFPNAKLEVSDLKTLCNWTNEHGYYIINHDDSGLTLTRQNPGELAWSPL